MTLTAVFQDALASVYDPVVMSFALACGLIALIICLLDWVGALLLGRSSLLGVGFGGLRTLQSILLWGVGAVLGAYLGGLVELFDTKRVTARVIVGVGWPTVLPRLLSMASGSVAEEEQDGEEKVP